MTSNLPAILGTRILLMVWDSSGPALQTRRTKLLQFHQVPVRTKPGLQAGQRNSQEIKTLFKKTMVTQLPGRSNASAFQVSSAHLSNSVCQQSRVPESAVRGLVTLAGFCRDFRSVFPVTGRPQDHEAVVISSRMSSTLSGVGQYAVHLSFLSSRPCLSSVSLSLAMTSGASSAVVAIIMSSTYAQYSSSVVHPTPCFSHLFFEFRHGHPQGQRKRHRCLTRTLQESVSDRHWSASRSVRPRCWLHTLFGCPQVGKDCAQNRALSPGSIDCVPSTRCSEPVFDVTGNEHLRCSAAIFA